MMRAEGIHPHQIYHWYRLRKRENTFCSVERSGVVLFLATLLLSMALNGH